MDLGLHYWNFSAPGNPQRIADTLTAAAQTAEEAGFAEFSVMDHYIQIEQRACAEEPMLEAYTTGCATRTLRGGRARLRRYPQDRGLFGASA
jgi:alkanesulfonate monooxygenase SsuD/methylene tetrahydromethanopterin reductase-like flavin-dependent oxidoreductase (luciferase family)